jgi:glutaredoxin-related protein
MLHVPFYIVFNDLAYNLHKDKFETLNNLKNKDLSLKFLSDVLIYLFDINILDITNQNIVYAHDEFKSLSSDFILDRRDLNGKIKKIQTFWNFEGTLENSELTETQFKNQDTSISLWQLKNYLEKKGLSDKKNIKNLVCQHRANSYITQYKSSLSNGCFETDIFFLKDYVLSAHEIKNEPKLIFDKFLDSSFNKNTLWLDSKNLNLIENCQLGEKWLKTNYQKFLSLLVETPTDSINNINNEAWINCIKEINNIENIDVGYYLPTQLITECSQQIIREKKNYSTKCQKLYSDTTSFLDKTKINSITFDYSGYEFVKSFKNFKNYKWHIWHVDSLKSFNKIFENKNIGIVLLKNNRFTDNLN